LRRFASHEGRVRETTATLLKHKIRKWVGELSSPFFLQKGNTGRRPDLFPPESRDSQRGQHTRLAHSAHYVTRHTSIHQKKVVFGTSMDFAEHFVRRDQHRIYAREYAGDEPSIVLMHGFPDNLHLYDRVVPYLAPRRIITFDFLGWGASDKPLGYPYTAENQEGDLHAVIEQLNLGQVVLVAHDASGPPVINWALQHSNQISSLVLLNTYYCAMPTLRPPEAIFLFSTPVIRNIARPISAMFRHLIFRRMYWWQVGRFFRDAEVRNQFVPLLSIPIYLVPVIKGRSFLDGLRQAPKPYSKRVALLYCRPSDGLGRHVQADVSGRKPVGVYICLSHCEFLVEIILGVRPCVLSL